MPAPVPVVTPGPGEPGRPALGWGTLDRDQIVTAALELARADGLDGVTIRRVAEAVGASRMALYRHVHDKQELLDLVADEIAWQAVPTVDEAEDWRDLLRAIADGLRARYAENPAFIELVIVRSVHGRGGVAMAELITRAMAATGLPRARVAHYCLVFTDVVLGRIQREIAGDPTQADRNERLMQAALAGGEAPAVAAHADELRAVEADEVFATEVAMVIAAIEDERRREGLSS